MPRDPASPPPPSEATNSPGCDAAPASPCSRSPRQRTLTCLPAVARHRRRSQRPDGAGMSGCPSLPPPVAPFPATEEKLDPSSQAPAPRQQSEAHLSQLLLFLPFLPLSYTRGEERRRRIKKSAWLQFPQHFLSPDMQASPPLFLSLPFPSPPPFTRSLVTVPMSLLLPMETAFPVLLSRATHPSASHLLCPPIPAFLLPGTIPRPASACNRCLLLPTSGYCHTLSEDIPGLGQLPTSLFDPPWRNRPLAGSCPWHGESLPSCPVLYPPIPAPMQQPCECQPQRSGTAGVPTTSCALADVQSWRVGLLLGGRKVEDELQELFANTTHGWAQSLQHNVGQCRAAS